MSVIGEFTVRRATVNTGVGFGISPDIPYYVSRGFATSVARNHNDLGR